MTTENGRENETLEREGTCSAYASTRYIPYALGSGLFGSRKKDILISISISVLFILRWYHSVGLPSALC